MLAKRLRQANKTPKEANAVLRMGKRNNRALSKFKSAFGKEAMKETLNKGVLHKRFDLLKNEVLLAKRKKRAKSNRADVAKLADALDLGSSG